MSAHESTASGSAAPWTCPFCPLLCDGFGVATHAADWALVGSDCSRARTALSRFGRGAPSAQTMVDGVACDPDAAIAAAARVIEASRQPLFGGLGTDVAGARALYTLAARTGAICDAAGGAALWHGLHALQDRGAFTTTLAEVRARADLIVCFGALPDERYPEFRRRIGVVDGGVVDGRSAAQIVVLQPAHATLPAAQTAGGEAAPFDVVPFDGDLFDAAAMLAALVAGRAVGGDAASSPLAALAERLRAARYAVLVYETGRLPAQGALIVEAINRVVATLNQRTRAAALPLGGADGASTVNAVFTWLSGLPLRSRAAPIGLEHEPLRFDAQRLLADHAVDALLWIASYGTEPAPPQTDVPRIVLGHPSFAAAAQGRSTVFIPVSTPGIGSAGHLLRTDGSVMLPLRGVHDDGLPTVADVVKRLTQALQGAAA